MDIKQRLNQIKKEGLYRKFRTITSPCTSKARIKNKSTIMLASNNYFGLNTNHQVIAAAKKAIDKYGTGNVGSRLVINLDLHEKLEKEIAKMKNKQSSLTYSSGYAANLGIISGLVGVGDIILSDELNHASIIDGCRLSRADVIIYKHCDIKDLESKLKKSNKKNILVVTDSVFSMDGDIAPLKEIVKLKKRYNFIFMVDDAHATGIINTNFKGIDIYMGTLSKTMASQGGFAAANKDIIDLLKNTSRPFMYSTGLPPSEAASALCALKIIKKDKTLPKKLLINSSYFRKKLLELGFDVRGETQIIPLIVGNNKKVTEFQNLLENEGVFVTGIRYPTVKIPLLRICLMSSHTKKQLDKSLNSFRKIGLKLGLIHRDQTKF